MSFDIFINLIILIHCIDSTYIPCAANQDCVMDCNSYANGCSGSIINATKATSLTLKCQSLTAQNDFNGGCQFSEIYCPTTSNSACNIQCLDYYGCYSSKIYVSQSTNLNIQCMAEEGSCLQTEIYANYAQNVSISCYGSGELSETSSAPCQHLNVFGNHIMDQLHIQCIDDYSCNGLNVESTYAHNVNIFARGNYALKSAYIYAQNVNSMTIFCGSEENEYGCNHLNVYAPSDNNTQSPPRTNLICQGMGCKNSIYLNSDGGALDYNFYLNTCNECNGIDSCIDTWYIQCNGQVAIFHGDSCASTDCACDSAIYSLQNHISNDINQCDIFEFDYNCVSESECIIDCSQWTDGCYNKLINGKNAISLSVLCNSTGNIDEYGGCESSHIYCPVESGSKCNIECLNENACFGLEITLLNDMKLNNILNLTCYNSDSCSGTNVYANGMINTEIQTNCIDSDACDNLNLMVNGVNNVIIYCEGDADGSTFSSCNGFNIYAMNVTNEIRLICKGDYSCYNIDIYANYSNKISIECIGNYAGYAGNIYGLTSNKMNIECNSEFEEYGCYDMNFYISKNTSISCEGHGCNYLSLYAINGFNDIQNIIWNGCKECWKHSCINKWNMHCNNSNVLYFGNNISCSTSDCGCNDIFINKMNNGWSNDIVQKCDLFHIDKRCESGKECVINDNISGQTIWGGNATSLVLYCVDHDSCAYSVVFCPVGRYVNCNIFCYGKTSCAKISVYGDEYTTLTMECKGDKGCQAARIYAYDVPNTLVICFPGFRTCNWLHIYGNNANNINVNCIGKDIHDKKHHGLCFKMRIDAQYVNAINISCIGNYSCWQSHFSLQNANNVIINADIIDALLESKIEVQEVNNFTLNCVDYGCNLAQIYIPLNNSNLQLNCYGYGCYDMILFTNNGFNTFSTQNVQFNGCGLCNTVNECVNNWMIFCNDNQTIEYNAFTNLYNGSYCSSSNCYCNKNILNQLFINDASDMKCNNELQTILPTMNPLSKATLIPTSMPTVTSTITNISNTIISIPVKNNVGNSNNMLTYILVGGCAVIGTIIIITVMYYIYKRNRSRKVIHRVIREIVEDEKMDKNTEMTLQESLNKPNKKETSKSYIKLEQETNK
eukprot:51023_1